MTRNCSRPRWSLVDLLLNIKYFQLHGPSFFHLSIPRANTHISGERKMQSAIRRLFFSSCARHNLPLIELGGRGATRKRPIIINLCATWSIGLGERSARAQEREREKRNEGQKKRSMVRQDARESGEEIEKWNFSPLCARGWCSAILSCGENERENASADDEPIRARVPRTAK